MPTRTLMVFCFALLLQVVACDQGSTHSGSRVYDSLLFTRQGGGDIAFVIHPTESAGSVKIIVSHYQFRDTVVEFQVDGDTHTADAFDAFDNALNGRIALTGDFHQPTLPTGTWAHLYMQRGSERVEITNPDLRSHLMDFEGPVQNTMSRPE